MTTVLRPPLSIESSPTWLPEMRNARHWKYYDIPLFSSPMIERIKEFDARVAGKWVAHACPCAISVEPGVWSVGQMRILLRLRDKHHSPYPHAKMREIEE